MLRATPITSEEVTPYVNPNAEEYSPGSGGNDVSGDRSNYANWNGNWQGYLEYLVSKGDSAAADKLFSYLMSEQSAQTARDWTANREDTQYQRLVDDLKAAGINPYAMLASAGSPVSSSSGGNSFSGSQFTSRASAEETERNHKTNNSLKLIATILSLVTVMAAVL